MYVTILVHLYVTIFWIHTWFCIICGDRFYIWENFGVVNVVFIWNRLKIQLPYKNFVHKNSIENSKKIKIKNIFNTHKKITYFIKAHNNKLVRHQTRHTPNFRWQQKKPYLKNDRPRHTLYLPKRSESPFSRPVR